MPIIRTREDRIAHIRKTCKHFNGTMQKVCRAGITYDSVHIDRATTTRRFLLPCIKEEVEEVCTCSLSEFPTVEDAEAAIEEFRRVGENTNRARAAIMEATGGKRRVSGRIPCPICEGGTLGYSVAYNGHVHAKCSTQGCVCWME